MKLLIENFKKYISEESLGDFSDEGMVNLYHYTNPRNVEGRDSIILDPQYFVNSRGAYSKREWDIQGLFSIQTTKIKNLSLMELWFQHQFLLTKSMI